MTDSVMGGTSMTLGVSLIICLARRATAKSQSLGLLGAPFQILHLRLQGAPGVAVARQVVVPWANMLVRSAGEEIDDVIGFIL